MRSSRRSRRGLALILVLTVVLALSIIATPFVLSMLKQEKTATAGKERQRAWVGSEGASNWAVANLLQRTDPAERALGATPYQDDLSEFMVDLRDSRLSSLGVADPNGVLWGLSVEDEQAKLHLESCPERAVNTLKSLLDPRVQDAKDFLTRYSTRDAHWVFPQRVRQAGQITLPTGTSVQGVLVDNAFHYGRDTKVRASRPGVRPFESRVRDNYLFSQGANVIECDPPIPGMYTNGVIEVEQRHPINVCTARKEVLIAMWEGLRIDLPNIGTDTVSIDEARTAAQAMYGRAFDNSLDWAAAIAGIGGLSPIDQLAIILNALDPGSAILNGTGTVGICFVNADTVTIQGRAMSNTLSGTPAARAAFRQVVELAPPIALLRTISSQYDFDRYFTAGRGAGAAYGAYFIGYPWGSRIITAPELFPNPSDRTWTAGNPGYVMSEPARDMRGNSQYAALLQPREHFDNTLEGQVLSGGSQAYSWDRVFTTNPAPPAGNPLQNAPDVTAGGMEMWVRFDSLSDPMQLFDIRESDTSNRLTLRYESGELIFIATDCSLGDPRIPLDKGWAEIHHPFIPLPETWYHIGAYWKGTRYGHLALLVDGFSDPNQVMRHVDEDGTTMQTELSSDLAIGSTGVSLKDNSWVPDPTASDPGPVPLLIGGEVVGYDKPTGTVIRAMRNTTEAFHPRGTKVTLFGYSAKLQPMQVNVDLGPLGTLTLNFDRLPRVNGQVTEYFGQNPTASVAGDKTDPVTMMTMIDSTQNYVPVTTPAITEYPQKGYIKIDNEVIYYDAIDAASMPPRFINCQRGQHGTTAANHNTGRPVQLWCVPVTDTANYLSPSIIQIDEEWIGPVQIDPVRPGFFIGMVMTGTPLPLWRGVLGSLQTSHNANELVLPLFAGRESDMNVNRHNLMRYDRVTLTDATNNKEMHRIRRASLPNGPFTFNINDAQLAGLWANVLRDYVPDQLHVRVVKWPSGELLGLNWCQTMAPQFSIGPGALTIDEVKFYGSPKGNFVMAAVAPSSGTAITMNGTGGMSPTGGAIKVGDEIVGYVSINGQNLQRTRRGWLNSPAQIHDAGDLAFNMSFLPIAATSSAIQATDWNVPLSQPLIGQGYVQGYVLIDQEVIGFEWITQGGRELGMPPVFDGTSGLLRGCFGTTATAHNRDVLVYGIPFRYWESWRQGNWDNRLPYWQASYTFRGARWLNVRWTADVPQSDPGVGLRCQVRCDGLGDVPVPSIADDSVTFEFTDGTAANRVDYLGQMRDPGRLDLRFHVEYRPGAFWPAHAWKRTPRLRQVEAEIERPVKVVFHQEK